MSKYKFEKYDDCNIFLNRKYDKYIKIAALRQKSQKS